MVTFSILSTDCHFDEFILQVVGNQDGSFITDVYTSYSYMCFIKT